MWYLIVARSVSREGQRVALNLEAGSLFGGSLGRVIFQRPATRPRARQILCARPA